MSNQYLKLRRSSVPGKVPDTSSIDFGEIALNTYDGLAFIKKSGSFGEQVVVLGAKDGDFTGSFSGSFTGSLFGTASQAFSASFATTSSFANNFTVAGTLTAQTLVVTTISSSIIYSSGSNRFGDDLTDIQTFTGSVNITGSMTLKGNEIVSGSLTVTNGISGSLFGTSSQAVSSSYAYTASSAINASASLIAVSASYAYTASSAINASASRIAVSSSYAYTASSAILASASLIAISSSYAYTASSAILASASLIAVSSSYAYTASSAILASASLIATSASYAYTASSAISSSFANSGTGTFSGSFSGSFSGFFSGSIQNLNGATNHIAFFDTPNTVSSSALYQSGGYSIIINQENATTAAPEALYVWQPDTASYNVISGKGNLNNYLQLNIQNLNAGTSASSDVVATADNGTELARYIDMGINGGGYIDNGSGVGSANDSYMYATGNKLYLGNLTTQSVHLFVGTGSAYSGTKLLLKDNNLHELTGSLNISSSLVVGNGITGSLFGTASQAASASYAYTASSAISASFAVNYLGSGSISTRLTNLETASGSFSTRVTNTETTSSNLVAASSSFSTRITSDSSSFSSRVSSLEATTASLQAASSSFSIRVTNTETTASNLVAASASFSSRVSSIEVTTASLQVASSSFSTRVTQIERTYATTGSNIFTGSQNILGAITASNALINGTLTAQTLVVTTVSSSVIYSSGSNKFGDDTSDIQTFTGSVNISGSLTLVGRGTINDLTGSLYGTASWAQNFLTSSVTSASYAYTASSATNAFQSVSSSYAFTASSAINASASLIAVSASYAYTASSAILASASLIATSASYAYTASSAIRASASLIATSASYSYTASSAILASASLIATSASYSYTASSAISSSYAYTASSAINASASLIAVSASYAYTASSAIRASASLIATSASYAYTASSAILASASLVATSASYAFTASSAISASVAQTASYVNPLVQTVTITGSLNVSGSTTQVGNNTLLGTTLLSGSIIISGSKNAATPTVQVFGDIVHDGYVQFRPVSTNINNSLSASYIYVSGSTNDLYFTQNGDGYANTTRLRWLEGNLYTGLLNGGLITVVTGSTYFAVASGSGIIVNLNASIANNPYPTVNYINWPSYTSQSLTYRTSSVQTFLGIDSSGQIIQQTDPFSDGQYNTAISLGTVLHQNLSTINGSITYPNVAYGWKQRSYDFVKAFGPLKLSGYTLAVSGSSTGSLIVGSGTAFADGRNYQTDPNNPSYITDQGTNVSKIFRYYQSGSTFVQDTNGGLGFTSVDAGRYNNNGTLTAISPSTPWSIQRVFYYPNSATKGIVVYYGNSQYASETEAIANIQYETFAETPNTQQNAIYLGAIVLRYDADFTNANSYTILPGGIFRSVGGSGGGGSVVTTTLAGLSDVSISGPTNYQPLVYSSTLAKWINASAISGSLAGNAETATTASYAILAATASYVPASAVVGLNLSRISTGSVTASVGQSSASFQLVSGSTTFLYVSNSGNVGVYNNNPTYSLDVSGSIRAIPSGFSILLGGSASGPGIDFGTIANPAAYGNIQHKVGEFQFNSVNRAYNFYMSSTSSLYIGTNRFIGINKTGPSASLDVSGSVLITGSLSVTNGITGSLFGTASWAQNAVSSSNGISSSYAYTASSATNATNALTASSADNFFVRNSLTASAALINGVLTAQTLVVTTVSSSIIYSSGSNRFGDELIDKQTFTGSVNITGSLNLSGDQLISGSLVFTTGSSYTPSYDLEIARSAKNGGTAYIYGNGSIWSFGSATSLSRGSTSNGNLFNILMSGTAATKQTVLRITGSWNQSGAGAYTVLELASIETTTGTGARLLQDWIVNGVSKASLDSAGVLTLTGSINSLYGYTGSLFGTASQADSASYAFTASSAISASLAQTASYIQASGVVGLNLSQIATGSVTASVGLTTASFQLVSGSTNLLYVSNSGNIGINNPNPSFVSSGSGLSISGSSYTQLQLKAPLAAGIEFVPSTGDIWEIQAANASVTPNSFLIYNRTDNAYRFLIDGAGNIAIGGGTRPSASLDVSGSGRFTNGLSLTGSVNSLNGYTGSLFGTASQATSASYAFTASSAISASYAFTASSAINSFTSSFALTASYVNPLRQNVIISGSLTVSASAAALTIQGSGSNVFSVDGTSGRLFQIDDSLSGSLFSVNTAAGLPVIEAFSDNTVRIGQFGQKALFVSQSKVGVGTETPTTNFDVSGSGRYTNGLSLTGSVNSLNGYTGSLFGTASQATSASYAFTASSAISASLAQTASFVLNGVSSSYSYTASSAVSSSYAYTASSAVNATNALSASSFTITGTLNFDGTLTDYATIASTLVGTNNVFTQATGSYRSGFFKYTAINGTNARTGEVMVAWNGANIVFTDFATTDIGATNDVTMSAALAAGTVQFNAVTQGSGWNIRSIGTYM